MRHEIEQKSAWQVVSWYQAEFPVSLKAYGDGPIQLSTDKTSSMLPRLQLEGEEIADPDKIKKIFADPDFAAFTNINVLPLIYDEQGQRCHIVMFDHARARAATARITFTTSRRRRKHPVYQFDDSERSYIYEVRYGTADANALQRGLWTNTKLGLKYFNSITGWVTYVHNHILIALFSHALVSSENGHNSALEKIQADIVRFKESAGV